jgi:hypothetical protein
MSRRDAFDCFCLPTLVRNYHYIAFTKMQESAQPHGDRYAILQRKLERLEKIHADEKKQV